MAFTIVGGTSAPGRLVAQNDDLHSKDLAGRVEAFFKERDPKEREKIARQIKEEVGGDVGRLAEGIRAVQVWEKAPHSGEILTTLANKKSIRAVYTLPKTYDPGVRYPLILCTADSDARPEVALLECLARFNSKVAEEFAFVAPERNLDADFHPGLDEPAEFEALMREVRRKIHSDTDRWFIVGAEGGGDAAWMTCIWHSHLFAGAIIISGYPHVPYAEQLDAMLLENLRDVPVLSIWRAPSEDASNDRAIRVAMHNRALVAMAESLSQRPSPLPLSLEGRGVIGIGTKAVGVSITGVELPASPIEPSAASPPSALPSKSGQSPAILDRAEVEALLKHRRPDQPTPVARWFRFAGQGNAGWLEGTGRPDGPWTADTLSIISSPQADRSDFIREVLKSKLSGFTGELKENRVEVTSHDCCSSITLRLPIEMVRTPHKLLIRWNDRTRWDAEVHADIATLLSEAYDHWEFQHLVGNKITLRSQGEGN